MVPPAQLKQLFQKIHFVRLAYRRLWFFFHSPSLQRQVWRVREWVEDRAPSDEKPLRRFSVEFTITGRNDDYEPDWNQRLESVIRYNRSLFASTGVNFRVAFVEWNPPQCRPLLGPKLAEKFPFLRAIVVDAAVHKELCLDSSLQMMLNFPLNAALRTSDSDFLVISGGDVFFGSDVARWMARRGLRQRCLYRATRVDIRNDLDFKNPEQKVLESQKNLIRVNENGGPPYYNACGDFILVDRASMQDIRGFDENIRNARLHLDSRCCASAMTLGLQCRHIGHVYHVDHSRSYVNSPAEDTTRCALENIPYRNPDHWGLANRKWLRESERVWRVS